jgi:hypothetical protein
VKSSLPDGIAPRQIGLRLAFLESLERFLTLVCGQSRRSAEFHATGFRTLPAITGTGHDQFALELGKSAEGRQYQPAVRRRGVGPGVGQRLEAPDKVYFMPLPLRLAA